MKGFIAALLLYIAYSAWLFGAGPHAQLAAAGHAAALPENQVMGTALDTRQFVLSLPGPSAEAYRAFQLRDLAHGALIALVLLAAMRGLRVYRGLWLVLAAIAVLDPVENVLLLYALDGALVPAQPIVTTVKLGLVTMAALATLVGVVCVLARRVQRACPQGLLPG